MLSDQNNPSNFVSRLMQDKELKSVTPYFTCSIKGHEDNPLDVVCLDPHCKEQGVICHRCQYHFHNHHMHNCMSLQTLMSKLVQCQSDLQKQLQIKQSKLVLLRELLVESVRQFVSKIIDHFAKYAACVQRQHYVSETKIQELTMRTDVVMHRLFQKRHIQKKHFSDYVKEVIKLIGSEDSSLKCDEANLIIDNSDQIAMNMNLNMNRDINQERRQAERKHIVLTDYQQAIREAHEHMKEFSGQADSMQSQIDNIYQQVISAIKVEEVPYNFNDSGDTNGIESGDIAQQIKQFSKNLLIKFGVQPSASMDFHRSSALDDLLLQQQQQEQQQIPTQISKGNQENRGKGKADNMNNQNNANNLNDSAEFQKLRESNLNILKNRRNKNDNAEMQLVTQSLNDQNFTNKYNFSQMGNFTLTQPLAQDQFPVFSYQSAYSGMSRKDQLYRALITQNENQQQDMLLKYNTFSFISPSRKKCSLNVTGSKIVNANFKNAMLIKTDLKQLHSLFVINAEFIALCGRFDSQIEIYNLRTQKCAKRVETYFREGIKTILVLNNKQNQNSEYTLIAGPYMDENYILSWNVQTNLESAEKAQSIIASDIFVQESVKYIKSFHDTSVSCIEGFDDYISFLVGYNNGGIDIFNIEQPQSKLRIDSHMSANLPVTSLSVLDPGRFFVVGIAEKIILIHVDSSSAQWKYVITGFYVSSHNISQIVPTSYLTARTHIILPHLIYGDLYSDLKQQQFSGMAGRVHVLRPTKEQHLKWVEEGSFEAYNEVRMQNSIKDIIVIEPGQKSRIVWVITSGWNHKLILWEVNSTWTHKLKLWEKELEDFIKPEGTSVVKARQIAQSKDIVGCRLLGGPKLQIVSVIEYQYQNRVTIKLAVVDNDQNQESQFRIFDIDINVAESEQYQINSLQSQKV